jgi:hypothetical protein
VLAFDGFFAPMYEKYVFAKSSANRGSMRCIDFNQGVDAALMTEAKMKKLTQTNIRPLRIAFDSWEAPKGGKKPMHETYVKAVRLAAKYGIRDLSNYLLYNTDDDIPDHLYLRLAMNIDLCEELGVSIYSFPMKYHPISDPAFFNNRNFTGKHWNRKYIRAIQAVLNSTHGKIGRGKAFFHAAFGRILDEFHEILMMPEAFIIERHKYDREAYERYLGDGGKRAVKEEDLAKYGHLAGEWRRRFYALTPKQLAVVEPIIFSNKFPEELCDSQDEDVRHLLYYYRIRRYEEIPELLAED